MMCGEGLGSGKGSGKVFFNFLCQAINTSKDQVWV